MHLPDDDHERSDFQPTNKERSASGGPWVPKTQDTKAPRTAISIGVRRIIPSASKPAQLRHVQMVKRVTDTECKDSH